MGPSLLRCMLPLPLLGLACTGGPPGDSTGQVDTAEPFEVEGDYVLAYLHDHFVGGGSQRIYVTVDTAQQVAIGPAHWDDPDPHGTTTMSLEPDQIQTLTTALAAVDVPGLSGVDLWTGAEASDRYYLDLQLAQGEHHHIEWDPGSQVPDELWTLQTMLADMAMWFLG